MSENAVRENKLIIIEQRLSSLYSATQNLEVLSEKITGAEKPLTPISKEEKYPTRALITLLDELPTQLTGIMDRISKATEIISLAIY